MGIVDIILDTRVDPYPGHDLTQYTPISYNIMPCSRRGSKILIENKRARDGS